MSAQDTPPPQVTPAGVTISQEALDRLIQLAASGMTQNSSTATQSTDNSSRLPALPQITSPTVENSKSLFAQFSPLEASLLLSIIRHDFLPDDLHKLGRKWKPRDYQAPTTSSPKTYPSLDSLLIPLNTFFSVLTAYAYSVDRSDVACLIATGGYTYSTLLIEYNQQYQWNAVLEYHMEYHNKRRAEMALGDYSRWGIPDLDLQSRFLMPHIRSAAPAKAKAPKEQQYCFGFQSGSCQTTPCPDKRMHKCKNCDAPDHGDSKSKPCPKKRSN
jgi:hypothetical protein